MIDCIKCKNPITVHESHDTAEGNVCARCKIAELEADNDALQSQLDEHESSCGWSLEDEDWTAYRTDCGHLFEFNDGGPVENKCKFCMYCGKPISLPTDEPKEGK